MDVCHATTSGQHRIRTAPSGTDYCRACGVVVPLSYTGTGRKSHGSRSARLRRQIPNRGACRYCTRVYVRADLTREHLVPRSRGGSNAQENLAVSCRKCNGLKGSTTDEEFLYLLDVGRFLDSVPEHERRRLGRSGAKILAVRNARALSVVAARTA